MGIAIARARAESHPHADSAASGRTLSVSRARGLGTWLAVHPAPRTSVLWAARLWVPDRRMWTVHREVHSTQRRMRWVLAGCILHLASPARAAIFNYGTPYRHAPAYRSALVAWDSCLVVCASR